jgi:hypothetical protein
MWHVAGLERLHLGTHRCNSIRQTTFVCTHCVQRYHQSLFKNQDNIRIIFFQHIWREKYHELVGLIRMKLRGQVDPAALLQPQNQVTLSGSLEG